MATHGVFDGLAQSFWAFLGFGWSFLIFVLGVVCCCGVRNFLLFIGILKMCFLCVFGFYSDRQNTLLSSTIFIVLKLNCIFALDPLANYAGKSVNPLSSPLNQNCTIN